MTISCILGVGAVGYDIDCMTCNDDKGTAPLLAMEAPKAKRTILRNNTYTGRFLQPLEDHIVFENRRLNYSGQRYEDISRRTAEVDTRSGMKGFKAVRMARDCGDVRRIETSAARPQAAFECNPLQLRKRSGQIIETS